MSPLLGFCFRVFCVFRGLSSARRITKDGWDSSPYLALRQAHKKTARILSSPSLEISLNPRLLALAACVLGFYGQGLFADTLAEIGQLGPAHTALAVDNHFFNAR